MRGHEVLWWQSYWRVSYINSTKLSTEVKHDAKPRPMPKPAAENGTKPKTARRKHGLTKLKSKPKPASSSTLLVSLPCHQTVSPDNAATIHVSSVSGPSNRPCACVTARPAACVPDQAVQAGDGRPRHQRVLAVRQRLQHPLDRRPPQAVRPPRPARLPAGQPLPKASGKILKCCLHLYLTPRLVLFFCFLSLQ